MQWKVLKQIPLTDVQRRVDQHQNKYGSLSNLHDLFAKGRIPPGQFDDYIEWTNMDHALRAYREGEDFEYLSEEDLDLSPQEYEKITPRRIELLDSLMNNRVSSINELAKVVGRDVKNVHGDLKILESLGFISFEREGRSLVPEVLVYEITLLLG